MALSYSSTLQISLARVQGLSLMVTTYNSTALKTNGIREDIFICTSFWVKHFLYLVIRHKIIILSIFLGDVTDTVLQITRAVFSIFSLSSLQTEHRLPCILSSLTSLNLIPSYMGLFHLLQMLPHRCSLTIHIPRFHHCEQPLFPSI